MNLINESDAIVVMLWAELELILGYLPKKALIRHFATDTELARKWEDCSKEKIVDQIFREIEVPLKGLYR